MSKHWVGAEVTVRAAWDARAEGVGELAERVTLQLDVLDRVIGSGGSWRTITGPAWEHVAAEEVRVRDLIADNVFRDAERKAFPARGYWFSVDRDGPRGYVSIRLQVGASKLGRRLPANSCVVTLAGGKNASGARGPVSLDVVDAVLETTVRAWDPESAAASDLDGAKAAAGRGHFAPVIGQRAWLSERVGSLQVATSGVRLRDGDAGTYAAASDELDSVSAVHEILATFEANGIGQIPRASALADQRAIGSESQEGREGSGSVS